MQGFILLHRKMLEWGWYQDSAVKSVFIHCLLSAAFKRGEWKGRTVKAGQFITSRRQLSLDLGLSERQIRTALEKLQATKELTVESTNAYTVITVTKWNIYQENNVRSVQEIDRLSDQRATGERPHLNNVNNENISLCCALPPKLSQIRKYIKQQKLNVNPDIFFEHYTQNGWQTLRGKNVVDWKLQLRIWDKTEKTKPQKKHSSATYDLELFEKMLNEDKG